MLRKYKCLDCGGSDAYRSRPRSLLEYALPFLLLKPVRCANCFRRTCVSILTSARDPQSGHKAQQSADPVDQPKVKVDQRSLRKVKAIAVRKGWGQTALSGLQKMGTLRCDWCGEEFVIGHPPRTADRKTAQRQARWLGNAFARDHEREKKHSDRIVLIA
jgi:hypothetical protein